MSAFSDNLKRLRKENKLTQPDLGEALHVSTSSYAKYERGEREPDIERILELARFFDVSTDTLLGFERKPSIGETAMCACHGDEKDGTTIQWHSVKNDGLPDKEDDYLVVVCSFKNGLVDQRQDSVMEFKNGGFRSLHLMDYCYQVTHWAPRLALPEVDS